MNTKLQNQVLIEQDGTVRVAGEDGQIGTADDVFVKPGVNGQAPDVDQFGNVTLPTGGYVLLPDGTVVIDNGNYHSIIVPGGTVITPNGNGGVPTINLDGSVNVPDGSMVVLPNGDFLTPQYGSVVSQGGSIENPDGSVINPDGSITNPGDDATNPDDDVINPDEDATNPGDDVTNPGEDAINPGEDATNSGEGVTKPSEGVTNPGVSGGTQNVATENPNTGDTSMVGTLVLGSMSLLGLIKNRKNKR